MVTLPSKETLKILSCLVFAKRRCQVVLGQSGFLTNIRQTQVPIQLSFRSKYTADMKCWWAEIKSPFVTLCRVRSTSNVGNVGEINTSHRVGLCCIRHMADYCEVESSHLVTDLILSKVYLICTVFS